MEWGEEASADCLAKVDRTDETSPALLQSGEAAHPLQTRSESPTNAADSVVRIDPPAAELELGEKNTEDGTPDLGPALSFSPPADEPASAEDPPLPPALDESSIESLLQGMPSLESTAADAPRNETPAIAAERSDADTAPSITETNSVNSAPVKATVSTARSEQAESIARQADERVRHGFELAGRGAYYAARAEFISALRLVAQGLDTEEHTTAHGKSLAAGLTAFREAEDFLPRGSKVEADLDIPVLIAGHTTPVLKDADNANTTALSALKNYLTYARDQFAAAAGKEISGSMALCGAGQAARRIAAQEKHLDSSRRSKGGGVLSGGAVVLSAEFHGRQRPGRAAGPRREFESRPRGFGA